MKIAASTDRTGNDASSVSLDAESGLDLEWECGYGLANGGAELDGFHHAFADTP